VVTLDSACRKCTGQETLESSSWNLGTLDGAVQCSMAPTPTWRPPVKDIQVGGTRIVYALISNGAGTEYSEWHPRILCKQHQAHCEVGCQCTSPEPVE
jgi:hypothetical protein